jgi:hypothetical protein
MLETFESFRYRNGNMDRPQSTLEKFFHSKIDHIYDYEEEIENLESKIQDEQSVIESYLAGDGYFYTIEGDHLTPDEIEVESYPKIAQYLIDVIYDTYAYQDYLIEHNNLAELKLIPELSAKEGDLHPKIKKKYGVDLDYLLKNIKQVKSIKRSGII